MLRSLRNRLILSQILPALLIIPLMGVALAYVLETRLLLPLIYRDLSRDATLMAEITRNQPVFWQDSQAAQSLVNGVSPYLSGRLAFVTVNGLILATSDTADGGMGAHVVDLPDLATVNQGEIIQLQRGSMAEVFTPVYDLQDRLIGIVRLTTRVVTISEEIYQLRYILSAILALGILSGIGLGSYLAFGINRSIQPVAQAIQALAKGDWQAHLDEEGPEEVRSLAQAVNVLVDQLNSLESARRQLLANLVHELGRPLGAIRSALQAMRKGADKDPQLANDLLVGMDSETARLQRLLEDLARLHDQVLGGLELSWVSVSLSAWLAGSLSPWEAAAMEKGVSWETDIPAGLPVVRMDPDRMAQALGNLLSNAVKFTPAGGQVTTLIRLERGQLSIAVTDTGPGIPAGEQERIFQPFYRGAHGRRVVEGMGLGLSIARDIAVAHGGGISLESMPGSGSRFTIRIPVGGAAEA